jgi:hypothetical protein
MPRWRGSMPEPAAWLRAARTEQRLSARALRLTGVARVRMLAGVMSGSPPGLTWNLIEEARARIAGKVNLTPVLTSATLDAQCGAQLYFKCENFQKAGAFKARGATNAVFALSEEQRWPAPRDCAASAPTS